MASLVDLLTKPQELTNSQPDQQEIQRLIEAKSGKAALPSTAPAASNIAEQSAMLTAKAQTAQQQAALTLEQTKFEQQQRAQAQQQELAMKGLNQQQKQALQQLKLQEDQLKQGLEQSMDELEFRRDAAQVEQLGTVLALQDRNYMAELDRIGRERNLKSKLAFDAEVADIAYGADMQRLLEQLRFKSDMRVTEREWARQLTRMGVNDALNIAKIQLDQANQQAMWTGIGNVAKEGVKAGAESDWLKNYLKSNTPTADNKEGEFGG